jgi:superfamily II DNA or RNA helicase
VTQLVVTSDELRLRDLVGPAIFLRARDLVDAGRVSGTRLHSSGKAFGHVNDLDGAHTTLALIERDDADTLSAVNCDCTCPDPQPCVHSVAVLVAALASKGSPAVRRRRDHLSAVPAPARPEEPAPATWKRSLDGLLPPERPAAADVPEIALQFELTLNASKGRGQVGPRIGLRPVVPGASGRWIRGGITWTNFMYAHRGSSELSTRRTALLKEILALFSMTGGYYSYSSGAPQLEAAPSRRIWDLLAEAQELGLPLVQAGKNAGEVTLATTPAQASLSVARSAAGLELLPAIEAGGERVDLDAALLIGTPAHGLAWWDHRGSNRLNLAPLRGAADTAFRKLLTAGPIAVPARDETAFLQDYLPRLRHRVHLTSGDASVDLPRPRPPVLRLDVAPAGPHRLSLAWSWAYGVGDTVRSEPLRAPRPGDPTGSIRDAETEATLLAAATATAAPLAALFDEPGVLAASVVLDGIDTVRAVGEVLPALMAMDDVEVVIDTEPGTDPALPTYREAGQPPVITMTGERAEDDRDWFDLAVTVSVDGETVPFDRLFVALAQEQEHLILDSGTWFSLDRDDFRRLGGLIAEARALQDVETGGVRLSRFQAGLWEELDQIGVVGGQAAQWQASVRALVEAAGSRSDVERDVPAGLRAELRPYQRAGFTWLAALYEYGLGGILADDMGLGKTLQTLALFLHVRQNALSPAPFLVVAPTSVVFNWAAEAERFAPGLRVTTISETRARRGADLAEAIAEADVVVTSYTLFRLEYEAYAEVEWAGMVLDEAQFVKNHQSQAYRCAKRLPAPFKLAITGTPMENNLMELWSLLSITAPGLFASPTRFTEHYRTPIEKNQDAELLDRLRRRIRPLMLRRTKEQVVGDLPDKQEQVIELELNPKHRKVYETHLARERQKVLGLLDDVTKNRFEIFRSLTLLRQASLDPALIDPKYAKIPSTKLDAMMEQVEDIAGEGHRTLIFSQFTRFLTAARDRLTEAGIEHCYLDGSTRDRAAVIGAFKTGTAPVFLISLKAGGVGLNLTEADYCIMLDPWWNPATEAQAVDRVHRIGQTRKVMVYRLVAKDTIEEKVMALKAGKAALFDSVMDGAGFASNSLTAAEIQGLLE